jgi:ribosomal protein S1
MQETVVRSGYVNEVEKLQPGQIVTGTVSGYMKGKATVQVHGCRHRGTIAMKNIDLEGDLRNTTIEKACPLGINVTAKVVKVTREPKIKIKLAIGKKFVPEE